MKLYQLYLWVVLAFIIGIGWLTVRAWRNRHFVGVKTYIGMNIAILEFLLILIPLTLTTSPEVGYFLSRLRLLGLSTLPVLTLIFMLQFTQQSKYLTRPILLLLWFFPILTQIIVWTPGLDKLFFSTWELVVRDGYSVEQWGEGVYFRFVYLVYQVGMYISAFLVLIFYAVRVDKTQRRSVVIIVGASLIGIQMAFNPIVRGEYRSLRISPLVMISIGIGYILTRRDSMIIIPVAYDQIIASVHDAVLVLNTETYIIGLNPAAERLLNVRRNHLMNRRLSAFLTLPSDALLHGEAKVAFEHHIGKMICEVDSLPLVSHDTVIGRILVIRDITARKKAEQKALELAFEREQARILGLFIHDASHEFRTPITIIKSTLYLISRQTTPDKRAQHIETIEHQIGRLSRLITDLQKMSALDNAPDLQRVETDLISVLTTHCMKAESYVEGRIIRLVIEAQSLVCWVDPLEFDQALMRLIDNAIRYSLPGTIIEVRANRYADYASIEIQDHGIGMDADTLKQAIERFYRKDESRTTAGFGLGLPIAKAIIELHGGTLSLESVVGQGTRVRIRLPLLAVGASISAPVAS